MHSPTAKSSMNKTKINILTSVFLIFVIFSSVAYVLIQSKTEHHDSGRRLSESCGETTNSTSSNSSDFFSDYEWFPHMSEDDVKNGGFLLYIVGSLYMFIALSIACDEYFVPALEVMTEVFDIPEEIAGATLMAAGGSAPELFTSFIGTFTGSAVGFGTIVGSAVFNVSSV